MDVHITLRQRGELSVQIYRQLLNAICSRQLRAIPSAAGLHLSAVAEGKVMNVHRVVDRARRRGLRLGVLSDYSFGAPCEAGFVIGYGAIPLSRIDEGVKQLAASL